MTHGVSNWGQLIPRVVGILPILEYSKEARYVRSCLHHSVLLQGFRGENVLIYYVGVLWGHIFEVAVVPCCVDERNGLNPRR